MFTGITFDFIIGFISLVSKSEAKMEKQINEKILISLFEKIFWNQFHHILKI